MENDSIKPLYTYDALGRRHLSEGFEPHRRFTLSGHSTTFYDWNQLMDIYFDIDDQKRFWETLAPMLPTPASRHREPSAEAYILLTAADILHILKMSWFSDPKASDPEKDRLWKRILGICSNLPGKHGTAFNMTFWIRANKNSTI